jgi:hypothetical protein
LSSSTAANLKAFIIVLSPHHYMLFKLFPLLQKLIHIRDVAKDLYAIMWLHCISLTDVLISQR